MNDLSLFNSNQKAISKEVVTTKQLAEILGVDVRTVQLTVQRLGFTKVLSQSTGGRPTQVFDEKQATLIKQEIQKHHNLTSRQIDTVSTELEENQVIANAMAILQRRNVELQQRVKEAERQITEQAPKVEMYNKLVDRSFCKCLRDTAQFIGDTKSTFCRCCKIKRLSTNTQGITEPMRIMPIVLSLKPFLMERIR